MGNEHGELALKAKTLPGADSRDLAELRPRLWAELVDLDVDAVSPRGVQP